MKMRTVMIVGLGLVSVLVCGVRPSVAETQGAYRDGVVVWEAVIPEEIRVVRMELAGSPEGSYVAVSVGRNRAITTVYRVQSKDVNSARVKIKAAGIDTTDALVIEGKRDGLDGDARLMAKIEMREQSGKFINRWNATFVNVDGGFVRLVDKLSESASGAIDEVARARRAGTNPPPVDPVRPSP
jgi:hypothetical protein